MKRILVPLDGSDSAESALSPAVALAIRHGAQIHLLSVVSTQPPIPISFADEVLIRGWVGKERARLREYLGQAAARVAARSPDLRIEARVSVGPVAETVREVAEELDTQLVVLTTHGRGRFGRAWLGSTADELVRSLERPILLLPATASAEKAFVEDQVGHVMVPLDGSEAAESVLDVLPLILPVPGGTRLSLVSVVEEGSSFPAVYLPHAVSEESFRDERRRSAEDYLAAASERVANAGAGVPETCVLTAHDAAHGLLRFCSENEVDVIALSTHGRGGFSRLRVGSVADKLIRGAGIPVLVTRRPSDERS